MAEPTRAPPWETRSGTRVGVAGLYKDPSAPPTPFLAPRPRSRARHSFSCRPFPEVSPESLSLAGTGRLPVSLGDSAASAYKCVRVGDRLRGGGGSESAAARGLFVLLRIPEEEEEEEEEDLFVFNDTIEGPRAPAVKPGRVTQA